MVLAPRRGIKREGGEKKKRKEKREEEERINDLCDWNERCIVWKQECGLLSNPYIENSKISFFFFFAGLLFLSRNRFEVESIRIRLILPSFVQIGQGDSTL